MATKVDKFTTDTLDELTQLKQNIELAAALTQKVNNRWTSLGKTNMSGWDAYNWDVYPFTSQEFAQALNYLDDDLAGTSFLTLNSVGTIDKLVKLLLK